MNNNIQVFQLQIDLAEAAWKRKEYHNVISALNIGFEINFYEESRIAELTLHFRKSLDLILKIFTLPEIRKTDFSEDLLNFLDLKLSQFSTTENNLEKVANFVGDFILILKSLQQAIAILHKNNIILGVEKEPSLSVGIKENNEGHIVIQTYYKIPDISTQKIDSEEVIKFKSEFQKYFIEYKSTELRQLLVTASGLLNVGEYWTSIEAFEQIAEMFPEEKASAENMIGANYFYLQKYEKAIERYINALKLGENKEMIEYNIWEACAKLIENSENSEEKTKWKSLYHKYFPAGEMMFE